MDNLYLIFICLVGGILLRSVKELPVNAYQTLNGFVIYVSLPAVALFYIPKIQISTEVFFPVGVAWITFLGSVILFSAIGKWFSWPKRLIGCLILTAGLGNTSFVGFPVIEALYGEDGLRTAILLDQTGSFLVLSTFGIAVAAIYSKGKTDTKTIFKKIVLFPPFIAFVVACILNAFHLEFSETWQSLFHKIAMTVTPVALVSVGLQLKFEKRSSHWQFLGLGLLYKLILSPAIIYVLYIVIFGASGIVASVSVMEAAMAPMITAAVIASTNRLKPKLSSMMIGFGIPLSFLTLFFWYLILR